MTGAFEENRLIKLLREFDTPLALSYLQKVKTIIEELEASDLIDYVTIIEDPSLTYPIALRIEFSEPMYLVLSHPLCRMHVTVFYPIEFERERFYVTRLGMLPVFSVDLNTITLIKFWSEAAEQISTKTLNMLLKQKATYIKIQPAQRNVPYSTMNFIIAFGADLWNVSGTVGDIMSNYLKYSYWTSPKAGFSFSTHFIHSRSSILYALKVAKTLCFIDKIEKKATVHILDRYLKVHKIKIKMLAERDGNFFFIKRNAYIPEDVLNELLTHENEGIDIAYSFLNAIILEVREKSQSFELLSVVSDVGSSYFELAQTLLGYTLINLFDSSNTVALVSSLNELKKSLEKLFSQIRMYIRLPPTLSEKVENIFDLALENLYPIFLINEKGNIYFLHPLFFSLLYSKMGSEFLFRRTEKGKLLKFLEFLEKMNKTTSYMQLYLDETLDEMSKICEENKKRLLTDLFNLTRKIKIAKLLRKCF
ncbi:MAG: hypothetical protein QXO15_07075 [Nitrososphaerota archaeon]